MQYVFFLFISITFLSLPQLKGQELDHALGEILVRLKAEVSIDEFLENENFVRSHTDAIEFKSKVSDYMNIWLLSVDHTRSNELEVLKSLRANPSIIAAQLNHKITPRETIPNDALLSDQWYLYNTGQNEGLAGADINTVNAWDITTGGTTAAGDEIVVAIIDNGISLDHPDLVGNIWINENEIPDNGLDDDQNGYMDDYYGYNIDTDNGSIEGGGDHGTEVAGLIGASGNDGEGMAGVNWSIKLMNIQKDFSSLSEADVLEGYGYILNQRMAYNNSNGSKGAFVVVTNASWGIDNGFADDVPLWCAFYDTLGAHGILSIGATTNNEVNVDEVGDLPTTCPSEYLISVTGSNRNDELGDFGFGVTHIDIAAPGFEIISPTGPDGYNKGSFGNGQNGTSFASPLVAGAIALAYSTPCYNFAARAKSDPAGTALNVRSLILDNVVKLEGFADKIASGGRLDVGASIAGIMTDCGCPTPYNISSLGNSKTMSTISWQLLDSISNVDARIRALDSEEWTTLNAVSTGLAIDDLSSCTTYEVQFAATCPSSTSDFSESYLFTTEGCCAAPENIMFPMISTDFVEVSWNPVMGSDSYQVRYRAEGAEIWDTLIADTTSIIIDSLAACTVYEVEFTSACADIENQETASASIRTFGCTECDIESYCIASGENATDDWLEQMIIEGIDGGIDNISGSDEGYGNYTVIDTFAVQLAEDEKFNLTLVPGFSYTSGTSAFLRAWIDYNFDGDFNDAGELIFDTPNEVDSAVTQSFFIPMLDTLGHTVMRVMMKSNFGEGVVKSKPGGCESFAFGEIEDYCIELVPSRKICPEITGFEIVEKTANMLVLNWDTVVNDINYLVRYKDVDDGDDKWSDNMLPESDTSITISGLKSCTEYQVQIISFCLVDSSNSYEEIIMTDGGNCQVGIEPIEQISDWNPIPNPFASDFTIRLNLTSNVQGMTVELLDLQGRILRGINNRNYNSGQQDIKFNDIENLAHGIYLVRLRTKDGISLKKLIKG